jgi:tetratricopeptide (TPR) repeat protein
MPNAVDTCLTPAQEKHTRGAQLYAEGRFEEALAVLEEALRETPEARADFWNDWGAAALACGRADKAEQGFRRALALDPEDAQAAANLGVLLAGLGRPGEAIPFLKKAAERAGCEQRATLEQLLNGCRNQVISEALRKSQAAFRDLVVKGAAREDSADPSASAACSRPAARVKHIKTTGRFSADDIELIVRIYNETQCARGTEWDEVAAANMELPAWFDAGLDPHSGQYFEQQHRLWSLMTGLERGYVPELDEQEPHLDEVDAVRFPAYFRRRDAEAVESAGDHILATGMILKHCGLKADDTALEYGAGFAQTALTLARLGVSVDTVDICGAFCRSVQRQADFFGVPLAPYEGRFGWNPRGDHRYKLILFYESFHHCLDFQAVVHDLKRHLAPDGVVLLAGEPILRVPHDGIPYPWGLRLHSEVIAVTRNKRWFELGFSEDFLVGLFTNAGFSAARMDCPVSRYGDGYLFRHRGDSIELATHWFPQEATGNWHAAEPSGRWTKDQSILPVDATDSFDELLVEASNCLPFAKPLAIVYGEAAYVVRFEPGETKKIAIRADKKARQLVFRCPAHAPGNGDPRALGMFVHRVSYRRARQSAAR